MDAKPQPDHLILHSGYDECLEFGKDKGLASIVEFAQCLKKARPDCFLSVLTVPQFSMECKDVNVALEARSEESDFDVIAATEDQRGMVNRRSYSYSTPEILTTCAKGVALKIGTFIGVKAGKSKERLVSAGRVRSSDPVRPIRQSAAIRRGHPRCSSPTIRHEQ